MDQEAFRKLANQLRQASSSGGPRGFFAGSGLLVALIAGGVAINASLFNGTYWNLGCYRTHLLSYFKLTVGIGQ
jgi:hypothetical protein